MFVIFSAEVINGRYESRECKALAFNDILASKMSRALTAISMRPYLRTRNHAAIQSFEDGWIYRLAS